MANRFESEELFKKKLFGYKINSARIECSWWTAINWIFGCAFFLNTFLHKICFYFVGRCRKIHVFPPMITWYSLWWTVVWSNIHCLFSLCLVLFCSRNYKSCFSFSHLLQDRWTAKLFNTASIHSEYIIIRLWLCSTLIIALIKNHNRFMGHLDDN